MLNLYDIENCSEIYGPGKRLVIWVQGCKLRCQGCWNSNMWSMKPKWLITVDEVIEKIINVQDIQGITLIGGEPMHQSDELLELVKRIKKIGYSIVLFTGYEKNELTEESQNQLWDNSDIIICGRYIEKYRNIYLQWRGSENQKVIFNTFRYKDYCITDANYCEIRIDDFGQVQISGFPQDEILKEVDGIQKL